MRPGTVHVVYTLQDSIAVGGHFYTPNTMFNSYMAGIHEHSLGRYSTNTEHLAAEGILFRYARYIVGMERMILRNEIGRRKSL